MKTIPENILRCLKELKWEIQRDRFNLTQLDQDAIELKLNELKEFIQKRYDNHGK